MKKNFTLRRGALDGVDMFLAVARHRSFRRAAAELGVTPSAAGQTVRALEARLGVAIDRGKAFLAAGADCVYPIGAPVGVLPLLRAGIEGPLNIHGTVDGSGPTPAELGERGATRVTFGDGMQRLAARALRDLTPALVQG